MCKEQSGLVLHYIYLFRSICPNNLGIYGMHTLRVGGLILPQNSETNCTWHSLNRVDWAINRNGSQQINNTLTLILPLFHYFLS